MTYRVVPAQVSDVPDSVAILIAAFRDDPIHSTLVADVDPKTCVDFYVKDEEKAFAMKELSGFVFRKAVDDSGKMVGYAKWSYPYTLTAEQKLRKESQDLAQEVVPPGSNEELTRELVEKSKASRAKHVDNEKDCFLYVLAVHPSYQRQGIGSLLLRDGLALADQYKACVYIHAKPKGFEIYKRHGWVQVDEAEFDLTRYGGEGIAVKKTLQREPGAGIN